MGGDKDFTRWLRDYDNRRLDPDGGSSGSGSKLNRHSSKYDLESMNWQEVQSIYLPEIENCWGPACNYLRKLWFKYKMQKRQGEKRDVILDISRILYARGFLWLSSIMALTLSGLRRSWIWKTGQEKERWNKHQKMLRRNTKRTRKRGP
jgi:hypothetical protein